MFFSIHIGIAKHQKPPFKGNFQTFSSQISTFPSFLLILLHLFLAFDICTLALPRVQEVKETPSLCAIFNFKQWLDKIFRCWEDYSSSPFIYIIIAPVLLSLAVSLHHDHHQHFSTSPTQCGNLTIASPTYLIFVIFFTRAKFLENKIYNMIYTVNCQFTQ